MTAASTPATDETRHPAQESVSRRVVSGSLTVFGGQIAIKIVSFAFSVIVIRYLGSEEYGKYAVCVAFGGLFTVFSDLGLATLTVKRVARDRSLIPSLASNVLVMRLLVQSSKGELTRLGVLLSGGGRARNKSTEAVAR